MVWAAQESYSASAKRVKGVFEPVSSTTTTTAATPTTVADEEYEYYYDRK